MTISTLPAAPARTDSPDTFITKADAFVAALATLVSDINSTVVTINGLVGASTAGTAISIALTFRSTTTDADPGTDGNGSYRLNNATPSSATTIYIDDKDRSAADITGLLDSICGSTSTIKGHARLYKDASNYQVFACTAITTASGYRKLTVAYQSGAGAISAADNVTLYFTRVGDAATFSGDLGNTSIYGIKNAAFNGEIACSTSNIDWTQGSLQYLAEPVSSVNWSGGGAWTSPGASKLCHLQLRILSDGSSTAQNFTWPANVKWLSEQWAAVNNKNAVLNFYWDGATYWAMGANEI